MAQMPTVYPRWRGEHNVHRTGNQIHVGLSPLARGTPVFPLLLCGFQRFIPAGAGNTVSDAARHINSSVYPRWRGEHASCVYSSRNIGGLSPLARGTLT